jgi:hypothetical protein
LILPVTQFTKSKFLVPKHDEGKAQERDRTADLVLTKDVLYRLSYLGISLNGLEHCALTLHTVIHQPNTGGDQ